jgi:putative redox protein
MNRIEAVIGKDHYKTTVTNGSLEIVSDEPIDMGGTNKGFSPKELLYSALATCTCITLRMYADRKEWPLEGVKVSLLPDKKSDDGAALVFDLDIELKGLLTTEQKYKLIEISKRCPVHKLLTGSVQINTRLL